MRKGSRINGDRKPKQIREDVKNKSIYYQGMVKNGTKWFLQWVIGIEISL